MRKRRLIFIAGLAILFAYGALAAYRLAYRKGLFPLWLPRDAVQVVHASEGCRDRAKCLLVYVAPWCPECHRQIPEIRAIYEKLKVDRAIGMTVVAGADSRERLDEMATQLGIPVSLDPDKTFKHAAGIRGVPSWLMVERDGTILHRGKSVLEASDTSLDKTLGELRQKSIQG